MRLQSLLLLVSTDLFYSTLYIGVSDLTSLRMCSPIGGWPAIIPALVLRDLASFLVFCSIIVEREALRLGIHRVHPTSAFPATMHVQQQACS